MTNILPSMRDWAVRNLPAEAPPATSFIRQVADGIKASGGSVAAPKAPKVYTPASEQEVRAIESISTAHVTYSPGCSDKRFARNIQGAKELTDAQRAYVWRCVWRYRRQIKDKDLVKVAEAIGMQNKPAPEAGGAL